MPESGERLRMFAALQDVVPGHYRIVRLLGSGGMGEVYLARDLALDRDVAIKFLPLEKTGDPAARRRLLREAQAVARLDHPAICSVHETGETPDGRAYLVMQYVEGETLASVLQRGPLPVRDALALCSHIAEALGAAHRRGIVHRDLKPGNVMVTPSGRPKLLDFGIAARMPLPACDEESTSSAGTTAGAIVGTPSYMSPEQVQQRSVDGRTDLFALGAVLFECLTGQRAFGGPTAFETVASILHVHPPAVSALRGELTSQHDALCWRLLAKEPEDRFQSADEVVGAIRLLLPDSARTPAPQPLPALEPLPSAASPSQRRRAVLAAGVVALAFMAAVWQWTRVEPLPVAPGDAQGWYDRGTNHIREGAYHSARLALQHAIKLFPEYAFAYARLAEAHAELDDLGTAREQLVRVSELVRNESRLPAPEQWRLNAIRSLVLRDVDASRAAYQRLVERDSRDAGAWLDLGRAHEAAGLLGDASDAYRRAASLDPQYAAAHLRVGYIEGQQSRRDAAVAAFGTAEALYRAASNPEGETEVLLRRAAMFDSMGELKLAREDLERARQLASASGIVYQRVRAKLTLSSVTASSGEFEQSEELAREAVQEALAAGLETLAAEGLVDLTATLLDADRPEEAIATGERAIAVAERRQARRTAARAQLQMAAVHLRNSRPAEALASVDLALPFFNTNRYRKYELIALSISSRAHMMLDELGRARAITTEVLRLAENVKDEAQVALALGNLSSVLTELGDYPGALRQRERAEGIHRKLGQEAYIPYSLANRADLLIRLGRGKEAGELLEALEEGIAAGRAPYVGRAERVAFLRAFAAVTELRCDDAIRFARRVKASDDPATAAAVLAPALIDYCDARSGRSHRLARLRGAAVPTLERERRYWVAAAALERGDARTALAEAQKGLELLRNLEHDELRWRLSAIGVIAARRLGDRILEQQLALMEQSRNRLKRSWSNTFDGYWSRPDLARLDEINRTT